MGKAMMILRMAIRVACRTEIRRRTNGGVCFWIAAWNVASTFRIIEGIDDIIEVSDDEPRFNIEVSEFRH